MIMANKRQMLKELKKLGVIKNFKALKSKDIEKLLTRALKIKKAYNEILNWNDVGLEIEHWINSIETPFEKIENKIRKHALNKPEDIGKK